jgi:hypothetical protein
LLGFDGGLLPGPVAAGFRTVRVIDPRSPPRSEESEYPTLAPAATIGDLRGLLDVAQ